MDEIQTSIDKIFNQFSSSVNNSQTTSKQRLSFGNCNDTTTTTMGSASKKRKYSYDMNDATAQKTIDLNGSQDSLNGSISSQASPTAWEHRRLKADLIESNAMIAHLKKEVENRILIHNQTEMLYSDKLNNLQRVLDGSTAKVVDLDKHLKIMRRRHAAEKDELVKMKSTLAKQKQTYDEQIRKLQRANQDLENTLRRTKYELESANDDLHDRLERAESAYRFAQEEAESMRDAHEMAQEKLKKTTEIELELERERMQTEKLQRKIQSLENDMSAYGEWKDLSKTFHNHLSKMPDMEKELERLKRDNKNLYDSIGHKLLLEEEVCHLKGRLAMAEKNNVDVITLRTQLQAAEKELQQYKSVAKDHCANDQFISPAALSQRIEDILQRDVILVNEKYTVKNEKNSYVTTIQELKKKIETCTKQNNDLQTALKYHKSSLIRAQKKMMLVAKERDCYRQLTENYEKDLTISSAQSELVPDTQLKLRVEMLEKTIGGYKEMCANLEKDIQSAKALPDLGIDSAISGEQYAALRAELDGLRTENDRLRCRKDELELQLEQICMKGAYNLDKYKVVHMTMNPSDEAYESHKQEVTQLKAEIERLKRKNRQLEQDQQELTVRLNNTITATGGDFKDLATLREQVRTLETKNQHLKEVYKAAGLEFREACYLMFGYRIDRIDNHHYKISSMYAESEQDYLHFRIDEGCLNMLETEYSKTLDSLSKTYLGEYQSVPAFLCMLQLDQFNKTTMI